MTPKERAARAMLVNDGYELDRLDYYEVNPYDEYFSNAESALAAIAEPSEAMIDAMRALTIYDSTKAEVTALWRAAHAAMMAEKDAGE